MRKLRQKRAAAFLDIDVYPVTGQLQSAGRSTLEIVDAIAAAGCKIFQLREKNLSKRSYHELAAEIRKRHPGLLMIVNDHLDVAMAVGADGAHLGTDDLPIHAARKIAPDILLGASTHSLEEALAAQEQGADYVNIGPIFPTQTKQGIRCFLGPEKIADIAPHLQIPFSVMGGIKLDNLDQVLCAGARRIAVVSAITAAKDPTQAAALFRKQILSRL
jgi:thiamine-phosphate pyrophosphorylase